MKSTLSNSTPLRWLHGVVIRKRLRLVTLCLVCGLVMQSCKKDTPAADTAAKKESAGDIVQISAAQATRAGLVTDHAQRRDLSSAIKVSGVIDVPPQNLISISAPMGGFLASTQLLPGMHISKGQVIATMEDQSYVQLQQDFLVAQSRVEVLRKDLERQRGLNQTKTTSDKSFEQLNSEFHIAEITQRALAEKLRLININPEKLRSETISRAVHIVSPINGYVSDVNVNIGAYVNASDVLFELVNPTDLHLALNVFEKDLPFMSVGQRVVAHLTADPTKTFEAEIILVGKKLNENRAATVHCHFHSTDREMLPGMFVNADVQLSKPQVLCLPEESLVRFKESEYVFVEVGTNQFRRIKVQRGSTQNGWVEIMNDTESLESKKVVTKNPWSLLMVMENTAE